MIDNHYEELYEAVYFFDRIYADADSHFPWLNEEALKSLGINTSIYKAMIRILVVNQMLAYDGSCLLLTPEHREKHQHILTNIIHKTPPKAYEALFNKALNESQFFFDSLTDLEYEIYARCDFPITFEIGKEVAKHINLDRSNALELGGNSGGLGTALTSKNENGRYTLVDTPIPCRIGHEFKALNRSKLTFIEGNIFALKLPPALYDYIILMNLLHDFDDTQCLCILRNCMPYCSSRTKFLVIEDILTGEFEPKEVIMHGLRLSVECRGGKQRTVAELERLFLAIQYGLERRIPLNAIHTLLVMGTH